MADQVFFHPIRTGRQGVFPFLPVRRTNQPVVYIDENPLPSLVLRRFRYRSGNFFWLSVVEWTKTKNKWDVSLIDPGSRPQFFFFHFIEGIQECDLEAARAWSLGSGPFAC